MDWDLGLRGLAVLAAMSCGFGLVTALLARRHPARWIWPIATIAYLAGGLFTSEVWFGWATEEELQPNIDGLSFDEVLLLVTLPLMAVVLIARSLGRRQHRRDTRLTPARPA
jgi:hypothetical protein